MTEGKRERKPGPRPLNAVVSPPVVLGGDGRPTATLYCADCLTVLPTLGKVDAVVTDPPYGMGWDNKVTRAEPKRRGTKTHKYGVVRFDDSCKVDLEPLLSFKKAVIWGFQHFADRLPNGSALVWIKRYDSGYGSFLSDADLAWVKGGCGVYCRRDTSLQGEEREHPTQKPTGIMAWSMERAGIAQGETVLDPYMGSGTTGVACAQTGRDFIGIEIDPGYFEIAVKRIKAALAQPSLFGRAG